MPSLAEILKPLDPGNSQPLYQQLQRVLREAIESRVLAPDDASTVGGRKPVSRPVEGRKFRSGSSA